MKNRIQFIAIVGAMVFLASCSDDQPAGRIEITRPAADLTFDEAFVKERDIYFNMPEDIVLGQIYFIVVNSKGNLIVVDGTQHIVFQTDAVGNYLRQIGARGGGEGEYFYVLKMRLDSNGDLYIYSVGESMKYLVFSGDSYAFKQEIPDPIFATAGYIDHIAFTEGGNIYASQVNVTDGGLAGVHENGKHALFRLDRTFNKVSSLYPVEDIRTAAALERYHNTILTPRTGGGFYFMYPTVYEIYQYSEQGELEQTLFSTYRSKHRDGIQPFPTELSPSDFNPKIEAWFAEHIVRSWLYECGPDLLVLEQMKRDVGGEWKYYLNLLYKDGYSVADGLRVPPKHKLVTVDGSELYFSVEGAFDEAEGKVSDPYVAVYRLNDREGAGKRAFSRSPSGQ